MEEIPNTAIRVSVAIFEQTVVGPSLAKQDPMKSSSSVSLRKVFDETSYADGVVDKAGLVAVFKAIGLDNTPILRAHERLIPISKLTLAARVEVMPGELTDPSVVKRGAKQRKITTTGTRAQSAITFKQVCSYLFSVLINLVDLFSKCGDVNLAHEDAFNTIAAVLATEVGADSLEGITMLDACAHAQARVMIGTNVTMDTQWLQVALGKVFPHKLALNTISVDAWVASEAFTSVIGKNISRRTIETLYQQLFDISPPPLVGDDAHELAVELMAARRELYIRSQRLPVEDRGRCISQMLAVECKKPNRRLTS